MGERKWEVFERKMGDSLLHVNDNENENCLRVFTFGTKLKDLSFALLGESVSFGAVNLFWRKQRQYFIG